MTTTSLTLPSLPEAFDGLELTALLFNDVPVFPARDVGRALGYADEGRRFVDNIRSRWGDELIEGQDYHLVKPDDLGVTETVTLNNRGQICLTQGGVQLAVVLSRKPLGQQLRRWLVDELFPWLEEQGNAQGWQPGSPGRLQPPARPAPPAQPASAIADLRRRSLRLREAREVRLQARARCELIDVLVEAKKLTPEQAAERKLTVLLALEQGDACPPLLTTAGDAPKPAQHMVEDSTPRLPARVPEGAAMLPAEAAVIDRAWMSPMQLAAQLRMPGTAGEVSSRIGKAITAAGLRNHPELSRRAVVNKKAGDAIQVDAEGNPDTTWGSVYDPSVLPRLRTWMCRERPAWLGLTARQAKAAQRADAERGRPQPQSQGAELHHPA